MIYPVILILVLVIVVFVYRESSGFNIVKYSVDTDKDIASPVNFVMLSDLHDTDVTRDNNKRLIESIKGQNPDFIILAGDMITSYTDLSEDKHVAFDLIKELSGVCPVFYGLGNHEQRYKEEPDRFPGKYEEIVRLCESCGVRLLSDCYSDDAKGNIRIYGFDIPISYYKRAVRNTIPEGMPELVLGKPDENLYNILIAHTPDFFDDYVRFGPDLVLCGHLHGGIIGLPGIGGIISPQLRLFPKYDFGKFIKDRTTMIVSRGIGWHSIPIRIFNKAEIVSVTISNNTDRGDKNGDQR